MNNGEQSSPAPAHAASGAARPKVSQMFGEIVWLLTQSPLHKQLALSDLEWLIMPPVLLEQYRVFRDNKGQPIGVALWAYLNAEAEAKLEEQKGKLRAEEWKSGDRLWLVELVAPFARPENKMLDLMLKDLAESALKGKKIKFHMTDPKTRERRTLEFSDQDLSFLED